jgi:uncharacterized OsmC-like protein
MKIIKESKMITYPVSFYGKSQAGYGIKNPWDTSSSNMTSGCSVPVEFEGAGGSFSPEDYFLLSLQNCFVATFKVYSEYSKLIFETITITSELIVDKSEENKPIMKTIILHVELFHPSDEKKAHLLIKKTVENGFILQSVKTEIIVQTLFRY